jgi:transposase
MPGIVVLGHDPRPAYPSDLSDARRALIEPILSAWRKARIDRRPTGKPAPTDLSLSDNTIGIRLLDQAKNAYPTISKAWVDTGFKNAAVEHGATIGIDVEVVPRNSQARGFQIVKRRWVVERCLGWLMLHRRLARDYETLDSSSEAMIHIASIDNLTRRITGETTPTWRGTY